MKYFLFAFFLFPVWVGAQNLVPNPLFEDTIACPRDGRVRFCKYWINCGQTPDYDNACAPYPFSVPSNVIGYRTAATGNAYCDLWTYATTGFYREYIGVSLLQPMIKGHEYSVAFKCSPGTLRGYSMLTNKLGMLFSTVAYDSIHSAPTDNFAQVYTDTIVSDTTNWTIVEGNFVADSAYIFLTIGNFFDDTHTDTLSLHPGFSFFGVYYIDDVSVSDTYTNVENINSRIPSLTYYQYGNELSFNTHGELIKNISLIDCLGRTVISKDIDSFKEMQLNVSELSKGIYIVKAQTQISNYLITKCFIN